MKDTPSESQNATFRILLIEDNPGDARLIQEMLGEDRAENFEVTIAEDLTTGMDYGQDAAFDCILLDLSLPDSQGLGTLETFMGLSVRIPIVVLTGFDESMGIEALNLGAQDFLSKDQINPSMLIRAIRYAIQRSRTEEVMREAERLSLELEQEKQMRQLRGRFIELVSHEFRTPLTTILSSANLIELKGEMMTREQQLKHARKIQEATITMTELLDNVLAASLAQSGQLEISISPFDLKLFCQDLLSEFQKKSGFSHHIEFQAAGNCSRVYLDSGLIGQMLRNLLSNAVNFSPPGSTITIDLNCTDDQILLSVSDQGIGIHEDEKDSIFEFMFKGKRDSFVPGIGLGLSIIKYAVALHGGTIHFESEPDQGTTFTIAIPIVSGSDTR